MQVSSITTRKMVEALLGDIQAAMDGTSLRPKNAAALIWGCLSAVSQDERAVGDPSLVEILGWAGGGGTFKASFSGVSDEGGSGGARTISPDALCVARQGTLMNTVLTGLQSAATGARSVGDGIKQAKQEMFVPVYPSLFAASAMMCLEPCPHLRVPHPQMATVIESLFRGGHGPEVETRCISLALSLADKEQAYSTWLRGLFREPFIGNVSKEARRHLVSLVDKVALKVPSGTTRALIEEVWSSLTSTRFALMLASSSELETERMRMSSEYSEDLSQVAMFLSGMRKLAAGPVEAAADSQVASVTTASFLPAVIGAFADHTDLAILGIDAPEALLWNTLVGLLFSLPRHQVEDAIAFKPGVSARSKPADRKKEIIRAYLISRLGSAEEAQSIAAVDALPNYSSSTDSLGYVTRWATLRLTDREASAAVLPHLAEGLKSLSATAARASWFQTLLDTASLRENCPIRATSLLAGVAVVWEPSTREFLVMGERAEELLGQGTYRFNHGGALLHALTITAPRAVARVERGSPGFSADILARLFRLSGLMRGRKKMIGAETAGRLKETEEAQLGVDGFVRGLKHSPPVLNGTLSEKFSSYAEAVAAKEALYVVDGCD